MALKQPGSAAAAPIPQTGTETTAGDALTWSSQEAPSGFWTSLAAGWQLTFENWATKNLIENNNPYRLEKDSDPKIDANTLNQMFPGMGRVFSAPTTMAVAEEVARQNRHRNEIEGIRARGPKGFVFGATDFVTSGMVAAIDPINIAAGFIAAPVVGAVAGGNTAATSAVGAFSRNLAINFMANAPGELVSQYYANKRHEDYDSLTNIVAGSVVGAAIHTPLEMWHLRRAAPELAVASHEAAVARLLEDRDIPASQMAKVVEQQFSPIHSRSVLGEYNFVNRNTSELVAEGDYFHGQPNAQATSVGEYVMENNLGPGVYLTDNPSVANGHAANAFGGGNGRIDHIKIDGKELQIINLERRMDHGPVRDIIEPYVEEAFGKRRAAIMFDTLNGKEIIQNLQVGMNSGHIPTDSMAKINANLKESGFDGYRHVPDSQFGAVKDPHNVVVMFDDGTGTAGGKLQRQGEFLPAREATPGLTRQMFQDVFDAAQAPQSDMRFDADAKAEYDAFVQGGQKTLDLPDMKLLSEEAVAEIDSLAAQGHLPQGEVDLVKQDVAQIRAEGEFREIAVKAAMFCLGGP